jgi:hypothetical protein
LRQTYVPLFVRCDVCPRYARLYLAEIRDTDYRTKTFSCSRCGAGGALAITEPNTETGMTDYQLDKVEAPRHHPGALARLTGPPKPACRLSAKRYGAKAPTRYPAARHCPSSMCRKPRFTPRLLTASLSKLDTWRGDLREAEALYRESRPCRSVGDRFSI